VRNIGVQGESQRSLMPSVLIADDHQPTRTQLRSILESGSIDVCGEATSGREAIEKVVELAPDLVLLDIYMPNVNGVAAAYEIRRVAPATRIVFFTNYEIPRNSAAWRVLGGDAFVSKSSGIVELLATVKRFLAGGTMTASSA
jgi:DNA-binding NarL/FixJ family response regulator